MERNTGDNNSIPANSRPLSHRAILAGVRAGFLSALFVLPCYPAPILASLGPVSTQQLQTIVATGSGFGSSSAFTGNSLYIEFFDVTKGWAAGYVGPCYDGSNYYPGFCNDAVTLIVKSWTDSSIVLGGFSGAWGFANWTLDMGDKVQLTVWNPQTGAGPASITAYVGVPEPGGMSLFGVAVALFWAVRFRNSKSGSLKIAATRTPD